ncbi:MAG: YqgE/AlgH family protein [Acidimicrobiales bacterium]
MDHMHLGGRLLVANPQMVDPNFDRTVVVVLAHGDAGAIGVVLNRPSTTAVEDPLPQWSSAATDPAVVFAGGPVNASAVICLARTVSSATPAAPGLGPEWAPGGWMAVAGDVGTLYLDLDPDDVSPHLAGIRIFAGYAGWSPGQLEAELEAEGWFVVDAEPEDLFGDRPGDLWRIVLRRQRGPLALVAAYPPDPTLN